MQIGELLQQRKKETKRSERSSLLDVIYGVYSSQQQRNLRKKENWKRYIAFLKEHRMLSSLEAQNKFKKTKNPIKNKNFIREHNITSVCVLLSHIPTPDLYYLKSMALDSQNRNLNFGAYLLGSLKVIPKNN